MDRLDFVPLFVLSIDSSLRVEHIHLNISKSISGLIRCQNRICTWVFFFGTTSTETDNTSQVSSLADFALISLNFNLLSLRKILKIYLRPCKQVDHQSHLGMYQQYRRHQRKRVSLDSNVSLLVDSFSDIDRNQRFSLLQIAIVQVVEYEDCPCSHRPIQL